MIPRCLQQVLLAVIPIAWLIIAMTALKMSGVKACGIGLIMRKTILWCILYLAIVCVMSFMGA